MKKNQRSFIAALTLPIILANSAVALAKPVSADKVQVMKAIAVDATIRPHQSDFPDPIRFNLIKHVSHSLDQHQPIKLFGEKKKWQPLNKVKSLTEPGIQVLKLELSASRFSQGKLTLNGFDKASLYQNGQLIKGDDNAFSLSLINGDHRLLVLAEQVNDWKKVSVDWTNDDDKLNPIQDITFHQDSPKHRLNAEQVFDSEVITKVSLSPDGKQFVWSKRSYSPATKNKATYQTELVDAKSLKVLYRWQGMTPSYLNWSGDNETISYTKSDNLYLLSRSDFALSTIAKGLKGASGFNWLNNDTILFSWNRADESKHEITKRFRALQDRWSGWRDNAQLFALDIHSGFIKQLTQHKLSHSLLDIDSEHNRLLLSRYPVDYKQPAHGITELIEYDIDSGTEKLLGKYRTLSGAAYSKKGIYITAGPDFAEGAGLNIDEGQVANNYDYQLYFMAKNGKIKALSKDFNPSISQFDVLANDDLVLKTIDQDRHQLYLYTAKKARFERIDSQLDVVSSYSVSQQRKASIIYRGTTATSPQKVFFKPLNKKPRLLIDSAKTAYANSTFSELKDWDFTNAQGDVIDGRFYLPPNFDASKKYPMITYYYGGTSPVTRGFTGRWPFSLWAAQGYVVYIIQPSGATGYGQKFSAKHVNDWGKFSAVDIINSTKAFLKEHTFVDEKRVGNMGASYGGFMTLYLATQTELFSASVSHAGISNLAEYWGYGNWGYGYSGVASKGSFPWNNRSLYVDRSPLFNADKINTPLLLLHGDSDTNVPVTESHQMFTALKLLDKEVELIEFANDDHHIQIRAHRLRWWSTMLAYFDKQLKGQPLWWDTLYPEE
ncbi:MAG: dipeptidyl aminopeptidase/acylaminoacyl peptidase [Phenylobacterium sp.]|jgi:dipeptidyl aminopeptidase/acylaminoacyl peptidase